MIPGGTKDLDPICAAAPNHRLRVTTNANPGMVNCEVCGGEAPLAFLIDDGQDTPATLVGLNAQAAAILNGTQRANPHQLVKLQIAVALTMRQYCNALLAGTYTNKTLAQLRSDVATQYQAL